MAANGEDFATLQEAMIRNEEGNASPSEEPALTPEPVATGGKRQGRENWTQNVARRIREERRKAQEELVNQVFGSPQELEQYQRQQEQQAQDRVQREQAQQDYFQAMEDAYCHLDLASRPGCGPIYQAWQKEVEAWATTYEVDRETAFLLLLGERLPEILERQRQQVEENLLAELLVAGQSPGGLADNGSSKPSLTALDDEQFARLLAQVKNQK